MPQIDNLCKLQPPAMLGSFTGGENSMQKGSRVQFHISPVKSGLVSAVAKGISVLHRIHICVCVGGSLTGTSLLAQIRDRAG